MAKYYIKEESLTSIADSIRNIYSKTGELSCSDMAGDLSDINDEVDEQTELVDKIARKFFIVDEDAYLEGNLNFIYNSVVTSVRGQAFYSCDALTSVNLPNAISIGKHAFYSCDALTSVDLPNATSIGQQAFDACNFLASVNLPSATSIGYDAFRSCASLTSVIIRTNTVCTLPDNEVFFNTPIASGTGYIYVPKSLIEQYKKGQYWRTYASQFRALEDYTIDGTTTGELDPDKI